MKRKIILLSLMALVFGLCGLAYAADQWYGNYEATTPGCEYDSILHKKAMSAEDKAALENDKRIVKKGAEGTLSEAPVTPDALGGAMGEYMRCMTGGGGGGVGGGSGFVPSGGFSPVRELTSFGVDSVRSSNRFDAATSSSSLTKADVSESASGKLSQEPVTSGSVR